MKDMERDALKILARYAAEERPPPAVDAEILARLRRKAGSRSRNTRWSTAFALAAAVVAVVWALRTVAPSRQAEREARSAAPHTALPATGQRPRSSGPPPADDPVALDVPASGMDPGVEALRAARELVRAGDFERALERLGPCPQTVGTDDLLEECEFLTLQALCGAGELIEGRPRIVAFRRRWPRSSHSDALSGFCRM